MKKIVEKGEEHHSLYLGVLGKVPIANPGFFGLKKIKNKLGVEYANGQFEAEPFDESDMTNEGARIFTR